MQIRIGPLPSAWVRAWATDVAESLRQASSGSVPMPFKVGNDFFARSRSMARQWIEAARAGEVFVWEAEADPAILLATMQYWRNLVQVRRDLIDRAEAPTMRYDAERFTQVVRRVFLDALVATGRMTAEAADRMESTWPRLSADNGESAAGDGDVAQHERDASSTAR